MISRCAENFDAYVKILKGRVHLYRFSREGTAMARQMYKEAIALDPNNPCAWGYLAWTHFNDARYGFTESRAESFSKAVELTQKALSLDPEHGANHSLLGFIYLFQRKHEKAMAELERALSLDPNNAAIHALYGSIMLNSGRFDEAVSLTRKAMRLNPYYPNYYLRTLGRAYTHLGRYDDAMAIFKKHLDRTRGKFASIWAHFGLAWIYSELGREDEAKAHVEEVFKVKPDVSLGYFRRYSLYKDPIHLERPLNALHKLGLPETPPLPLPDKPSIAVLAFTNMSGDPEQEYLSDGISEEIITALSKTPKMRSDFVVQIQRQGGRYTHSGQRTGRSLCTGGERTKIRRQVTNHSSVSRCENRESPLGRAL
jgi:tetratricopeptide (TPR) repeat protein